MKGYKPSPKATIALVAGFTALLVGFVGYNTNPISELSKPNKETSRLIQKIDYEQEQKRKEAKKQCRIKDMTKKDITCSDGICNYAEAGQKALEILTSIDKKILKTDKAIKKFDEKINMKRAEIAVTNYLDAIENAEYKTAYEMLSEDSKMMHSYKDFANCAQKWMAVYDMKSLKINGSNGKLEAMLNFEQDPASHAIPLTEESGKYKIIWHEGSPSCPYEREIIDVKPKTLEIEEKRLRDTG